MITLADLDITVVPDVCQEAEKVAATVPLERNPSYPRIITFTPDQEQRGLTVIYTVGEVWGMGHDKMAIVPQRTLDILDMMNIPYILCN